MTSTYKLTLLLQRRADLTPEAFADAWVELERDRPTRSRGLERCVFHRAMSGASPIANAAAAPYDAVIETWWTRKNDAADWVVSSAFADDWSAPRQQLLAGRPAAVGGIPQVIWQREGDADEAPVALIVLPVARRSLRFDEFVAHWTGAHAALALGGPGSRDRVTFLEDTPAPIAAPSQFVRTRYDGVGSITFASAEAMAEEFASEHYRSTVAPDEARFTDASASGVFVGTPVVLFSAHDARNASGVAATP